MNDMEEKEVAVVLVLCFHTCGYEAIQAAFDLRSASPRINVSACIPIPGGNSGGCSQVGSHGAGSCGDLLLFFCDFVVIGSTLWLTSISRWFALAESTAIWATLSHRVSLQNEAKRYVASVV